ncbi:MAG: redoxin domain-containing protein [Erysipelotrichaceae bacterium]|nr:redoxin domain-containing protein [Erysipelotrichaceae bacterium]
MKLTAGCRIPNLTFTTDKHENVQLYDRLDKKTILWAVRFIGCTICRYDIHQLAVNYQAIQDKGYQVFVVLQSDIEHIRNDLKDVELPFEIISDDQLKIYHELEIAPAIDKQQLKSDREKYEDKVAKARELSFVHGHNEGDLLQLPAVFLIDTDGTVLYAHYGTNIVDLPTMEELLELL